VCDIENDEFNSNGKAGKIAYTAPSVMDIYNQPYENFNGDYLPNGSTESL
jgi:hypothetical protein